MPVAGTLPITPGMGGVAPCWSTYFTVRDVGEAARKATDLGATICMSMKDVPTVGRFCGITSPQGVTFRVVEHAR